PVDGGFPGFPTRSRTKRMDASGSGSRIAVLALSPENMITCLKALFLLITFAFAQAALAQADFVFNNYSPGFGLDAPVYDADGNRLFGTNYVAELYGGITADSMVLAQGGAAPMEPVPFTRICSNQTGYFAGLGFVHFPGVPGDQFAWLQVRAWDLRLGETY